MSAAGLTTEAFNELLKLFLQQLAVIYPTEAPKINKQLGDLLITVRVTPKLPVQAFMESARPYAEQIMTADVEFFRKLAHESKDLELVKDFNLLQHMENTRPENVAAIFQYLQQLLTMGSTVTQLNPHQLHLVEQLALSIMQGNPGDDATAATANTAAAPK